MRYGSLGGSGAPKRRKMTRAIAVKTRGWSRIAVVIANAKSGTSGASHGVHRGEAGGEDEDAGHGREPRLEQDRADDEGRVVDAAGAAQPDDPRERRPDPARDVLGEHRRHLGLERDPVRHPDPNAASSHHHPTAKRR